ncbi:hypothetical protein D3C71_1797210 [compost metagenome]
MILVKLSTADAKVILAAELKAPGNAGFQAQPRQRQQLCIYNFLYHLNLFAFVGGFDREIAGIADFLKRVALVD